MADVFLSYSREDKPRAQQVAQGLEAEGLSVWWDTVLRPGESYDEVTERNLKDARAVVVLWSKHSVQSKWVRAEATLGSRKSALIPAMIEECDRPLMFELIQHADLTHWKGDRSDAAWKEFVAVVKARVRQAREDAPVASASADQDSSLETTFWTSVKGSEDPAEIEAYLRRFPGGHFVDLAKRRLAALKAAKKAKPAKTGAAASEGPKRAAAKKKGGGAGWLILGVLLLGGLVGGGYAFWPHIAPLLSSIAPDAAAPDAPGAGKPAAAPAWPAFGKKLETAKDCDVCPTLVVIPAGSFLMGSPESEAGRYGYEGPQTKVEVAEFLIGETEVTLAQWDACVADGGCDGYAPGDKGWGRGQQPAIYISWRDAKGYARWLSRKTGRTYRLPTEAEWEYAARAGETGPYWWGPRYDASKVARGRTDPVGSRGANAFGLKDVLGNAREWVEDCYVNTYSGRPATAKAVTGGDCAYRVARGGDWKSAARDIRVANRGRFGESTRVDYLGFRVAAEP